MISCQQPKSPCQYFPNCGGCDFLDLTKEDYQNLKKTTLEKLIKNQSFSSFPNPDWIWVLPHLRRKIIFQIDSENKIGFFTKKTKSIIEIDECFVAKKEISQFIPKLKSFLKTQEKRLFTQIAVTSFDNGLDLIFSSKKDLNFLQIQKLTNFAKSENLNISHNITNHITPIFLVRKNQISYPNFNLQLDSNIFIQATKFGLENIIKICRDNLNSSLKIIDLYAGFGAYSFGIVDLVNKISAFEGDQKMVNLINQNAIANNFSNKIATETRDLFLDPANKNELSKFDLAIINPPRNGASPQIIEIAKSSLKNLIYVSCNPESFFRDAKILIDSGFKITKLTALDQFYATKHLELIAVFGKE